MKFMRSGLSLTLFVLCVFQVKGHPPAGIVADGYGNVFYVEDSGTALNPIWRLDSSGKKSLLLTDKDLERIGSPHNLALEKGGDVCLAYNGIVWRISSTGNVSQYYPPKGERGIGMISSWGDPFTLDREGNIYCINRQRSVSQVLKLTPAGKIEYVAGGERGYADGTPSEARFGELHYGGMACGSDLSLYLTDDGCRIRKILPSGAVSTIAGGAERGAEDGPGAEARFRGASSLAVDKAGGVYVADPGNHRIRKITSGGQVSTLASLPVEPFGVAVAETGEVFVLGPGGRVFKIAPAGQAAELGK